MEETLFDRTYSYKRELTEALRYRKAMLNGNVNEHADMIVAERSIQTKRTKEQSQVMEQNQREKKELTQHPEIKLQHDLKKKRDFESGI
jgi:hypothetical protein